MKDYKCVYLDCDSYCHMNQCRRKHGIQDYLFDTSSEDVNSIFAYMDTYCDKCDGCGFINRDSVLEPDIDRIYSDEFTVEISDDEKKKIFTECKNRAIESIGNNLLKIQNQFEKVKKTELS